MASGGICGYFYGNFNYIENCISNTQLYSDKSAGGIVGEAIDNEAFNRIENCIDNSVVGKILIKFSKLIEYFVMWLSCML